MCWITKNRKQIRMTQANRSVFSSIPMSLEISYGCHCFTYLSTDVRVHISAIASLFPLVFSMAATAPGIASAFTFRTGRKRNG